MTNIFKVTLAMALTLALFHTPIEAAKKKKSTKAKSVAKVVPPKGGFAPLGATGILGTIQRKNTIKVLGTQPGSPAHKVLKAGDLITGVGGKPFLDKSVLGQMAQAVKEAETTGQLKLTLQGGAKVTLQIPKLGTFSPTAPFDCPKTDKIIAKIAKQMAKENGSNTKVEWLGLLATGEKKYIDIVAEKIKEEYGSEKIKKRYGSLDYNGDSLMTRARKEAEEKRKRGEKGRVAMVSTWDVSYSTIALAEYYYLTKDETVLPVLKTLAFTIVEGQDSAGLYGHKFAYADTGRAPGYGQMNQVSLSCFLGMVLAKKCGVDVPGLDKAIAKSKAYVDLLVDRGGFPYGYHSPNSTEFNNNGTSGLAAICFDQLGDQKGSRFFAKMAATAPKMGSGHASSLFSSYWSFLGAHTLGPKVSQKAFPKVLGYVVPRFNSDGTMTKGYSEGHLGGVVLLSFCAPRRALLITGRESKPSSWLDEKEAEAAVGMVNLAKSESISELLELLNHENAVVRNLTVKSIKKVLHGGRDKKGRDKGKKKKKEKKVSKGPGEATKAARKEFSEAFPKLQEMLTSGTPQQRMAVAGLYLHHCPEGELEKRFKTLAEISKNPSEPTEIRVAMVEAMAETKNLELFKPYHDDVLRFLLEKRPPDMFSFTDLSIARALIPIHGEAELKLKEAGLYQDKELFYKAAAHLMNHKHQQARGVGVRMVRFIPEEDLHLVIRELDYILKDDDKTYHAYHSPKHAIQPALEIFQEHDIIEGIRYSIDPMLEGRSKHGFAMKALLQTLPKYGAHAKPLIPILKKHPPISNMYKKEEEGEGGDRFLEPFKNMVKSIEESTDAPKMKSVEDVIKQASK